MEVLVEEWVDGVTYQIGLAETQDERDQCYRLRFETFCLNNPRLPTDAYPDGLERDRHDDYSWHFMAVRSDEPKKVIGTFRLIDCSHGCLLMDNKIDGQPFELPDSFMGEAVSPATTVEAARWIGPARGTAKKGVIVKVSKMLLEAGLKVSCREGKAHWICAIDPKPLDHLVQDGWPFKELLPGVHTYYHDKVKVCILSLSDQDECYGCDHTVDTTINVKSV